MIAPNSSTTQPDRLPQQEFWTDAWSLPVILTVALTVVLVPAVLAYLFATTNEMMVVFGVIGLIFLLLIMAYPFLGTLLFVGFLYMRPEETFRELAGMRLALIISVATLIGMVFVMSINRIRAVRSPITPLILTFTAVAVMTTINKGVTVMALTDLSKLVILIILLQNLIRTPKVYRAFIGTICLFTFYLAAYSIYLFHTGQAIDQHGVDRSVATGIFSDPNDLATTFVAGVALLITLMRSHDNKFNWLYLIPLATSLYAIYLTHSRGGLIALLVLMFAYIVTSSQRKVLASSIGLGLVALLFIAAPGRLGNMDTKEESANSRFHYWYTGVQMLKGNPATGVGYAQFKDNNDGMTAHNTWVLCFGELGLFGYLPFMGALYYCYRKRPIAPGDEPPSPEMNWQLIGARLSLTSYLAASFWLSHTYSPILFVVMSLPIIQQVAYSGDPVPFKLTPAELGQDFRKVLMISIGSILVIWLLAWRLM
jgi:putative inorganic carbon (hco3(-)) transporter